MTTQQPPPPYSKEEVRALMFAQLAEMRALSAALHDHTAALKQVTAVLNQALTAFAVVAQGTAVSDASSGMMDMLQQLAEGIGGGGPAPKRRRRT